MIYTYIPKGVCSRKIDVEIIDGKIESIEFLGGCNGNLKGISSILKGMDAKEAIERCKGITCGMKSTSCPDQLSKALELALENC